MRSHAAHWPWLGPQLGHRFFTIQAMAGPPSCSGPCAPARPALQQAGPPASETSRRPRCCRSGCSPAPRLFAPARARGR
eukprot:1023646-Alexandrium_andersonii.AAC.1